MPYIVSGKQYSGSWTMQQHFQAVAAQTWTGIPGALYAWGENGYGKLAQNDSDNRSSPVQVGALTTWSKVAAGYYAAAAIKTDGTLWTWGYNNSGQLGQSDFINRSSPVQVGSGTTWASVRAGFNRAAAIKTDGTLWVWGRNFHGQLGINTATDRSSPTQVGVLTDWLSISGGLYHAIATKTNGTLWTWGKNDYGQLGQNLGTTIITSSPVQVGALTNWLTAAAGGYHSFAIKTDGTLWAWGGNAQGQLGQNNVTYRSSPVQVGSGTTWSSIADTGHGSGYTTQAIKTDGTLWAWGQNTSGQLGQNDVVYRSSPVQVGSGTTWSKVFTGLSSTYAIKTDTTLWSWGKNNYGQLGQNDVTLRSSPVQVGSNTWLLVSAGQYFALAIGRATT